MNITATEAPIADSISDLVIKYGPSLASGDFWLEQDLVEPHEQMAAVAGCLYDIKHIRGDANEDRAAETWAIAIRVAIATLLSWKFPLSVAIELPTNPTAADALDAQLRRLGADDGLSVTVFLPRSS